MIANRNNTRIRRPRGFTLVEILIVVIILGILAAIVIPQFTNASNDARKSNLVSQLQTLRSQIELYKLQHKDKIPPLITGGSSAWDVFTKYTDSDGNPSAVKTSTCAYGPYVQHAPSNPLSAAATATTIGGDPSTSPGWVYDETTGKLAATGSDSTKYFDESTGNDSSSPTW